MRGVHFLNGIRKYIFLPTELELLTNDCIITYPILKVRHNLVAHNLKYLKKF